MRTLAITALLPSIIALVACDNASNVAPSSTPSVATSQQMEIRVSGTPDVQLDMLLVWKPAHDAPKRFSETITVPYSKTFEGLGGWAWFDSLPNGASGSAGDTYRIEFVRNGEIEAVAEGTVKPENRRVSGVGRW